MTHAERVIEDLGTFGVFWYRRPTGHTKTGARHRNETEQIVEWAFVRKSDQGFWQIASSKPGFKSRDEAIAWGAR